MIVVYPFSLQDDVLALKNARWMNELGGCKGHEVLVCYDSRCDPGVREQIGQEMLKCFDKVYRLEAKAAIDGWPQGANYFFRLVTSWFVNNPKGPAFLWLEPDAIPLKEGWLEAIEAEYKRCGKPFMGDRVQVEDIPLHMSGVGIYPNPLHGFAGEAYRAYEIAWDMAGKDQIVPQAHWTKLIEHAWKHPSFKDPHELETQIRKETVLFHSSKDGSLIDLLQSKRRRSSNAPTRDGSPASTSAEAPHRTASPMVQPVDGATCDIFIRTYPGDYPWLGYCLKSIQKFCTGFRKVWIVSPQEPPFCNLNDIFKVEWRTVNDESPDGYLAQQITKCYADVITDYGPDHILHVDSDVIFTRPCSPQDFFKDGKLAWLYTPYDRIKTPWQPITEKFMQERLSYEYMRRFPIMVPRWLYPKLREFCFSRHKMPLCDYIKMQPLREFSEFNVLGAYAFIHHKDKFFWVDTTITAFGPQMPEPFAKQFFSWGGITPDIKKELEDILKGGDATCKATPVDSSDSQSSGAEKVQPSSAPPPGIRELPNGIWVLADDTHISKWVEEEGRLDHDQNFLPSILPYIKKGDTVVDAGAFIGDHTVAYLKAVGAEGKVIAFEPNPIAYECLKRNVGCLSNGSNLEVYPIALGEGANMAPLSGNNNNSGGCYLGEHMKIANVMVRALDSYHLTPGFIKLDVEGCEVNALYGAEKTIRRTYPIMVIEVNEVALQRQGDKPSQIYEFLDKVGYTYKVIQENCKWTDPLYDILCLPERPPEETTAASSIAARPPVAAIESVEDMRKCVDMLREFADISLHNKMLVMQRLVYRELKKPNPKKKKK